MMQTVNRAVTLMQQNKPDLAVRELRKVLARDPSHAFAHASLAFCLLDLNDPKSALEHAREAVGQAPDMAYAHWAHATVQGFMESYAGALESINEAIRLDPEEADYRGTLAMIRLDQRKYPEALKAAEEGLALDPEHSECANFRAMAMVRLGRNIEAQNTLHRTLARDPNDALSHANQGWAKLHANDPKAALIHFREELRLNPDMQYAREGIVNALKARNFVFRMMLAYFLWMSRQSGRLRWGLIIGAYFGAKALTQIAKSSPELQPYLFPVIGLYLVFVLLSWLADPLFTLLLRLDRFGRLTLDRDEILASNWVGGALLGCLGFIGIWWLTRLNSMALAALFSGLMAIPISAMFQASMVRHRRLLTAATILIALGGIWGVVFQTFHHRLSVVGIVVFGLGILVLPWVANSLSIRD